MKNCASLRAMLFTDYIDGELDRDSMRVIDEHLKACPDCRQLAAMVKEDMSLLSEGGVKEKVPPRVWQSIVEKTAAKERKWSLIERLMPPRLAPALAGVILLVLSVSFFLYTQYMKPAYESGNLEYVAELFTNVSSPAVSEREGFDTPIEEHFL